MAEDRINRFKQIGASMKREELGNAEGFSKSLLWSVPELVGVEPPLDVQKWNAEHPVLSFGAGMAGMSVPYFGWAKAATKIPKLAEAIAAADKIAKTEAPFLGAAKREAITFLPFEAARVAGSAIGGEELAKSMGTTFAGADEVAMQAGFDLAILSGAGGVISKALSFGKKAPERTPLSGVNLRDAPQLQLRQAMQTEIDNNTPLPDAINTLKRMIRVEGLGENGKYVGALEDGRAGDLNRLFKTKETPGLLRMRFMRGNSPDTFSTDKQWQDAAGAAEIMDKWQFTKFPRYVLPKSKKAANQIESAILGSLKAVDSNRGWYFGRDLEDSLFIMARKLPATDNKKFDSWVVFKTDTPSAFVPQAELFAESLKKRSAGFSNYTEKTISEIGSPVWDAAAKTAKMPLVETRGLDPRKTKFAAITDKLAEATGTKDLEALNRLGGFVRNYLAPAMVQFAHDPRAARAVAIANAAKTMAEAETERLFHGGRVLNEKIKNVYQAIVSGAEPPAGRDSLKVALDSLKKNKDQSEIFKQIWEKNATREEAVALGAEGEALKVWDMLHEIQGGLLEGQTKIKSSMGPDAAALGPHHLNISKHWVGDYRIPLMEGKKVIGYSSGITLDAARKEAEAVAKIALDEGRLLRAGAPIEMKNFEGELELFKRLSPADVNVFNNLRAKVYSREQGENLLERRVRGHAEAKSIDEIEKAIYRQIKNFKMHEARTATRAAIQGDLNKIALENPRTAEELNKRIGYVYGELGPISKGINKAFDTVFEPALGKNSASKIVAAGNKYLFRVTLGFLNTGFNLANMLTFVQTGLPHLAYLASAAPGRVMKYYTHWPLEGTKSMADVGVMDIFKLAGQSFREMGKPTKQLLKHFERGAAEGVWDPRFVEEFVGEQSRKAISMRGALTGEQPFSESLAVMADFIPATTEKFARGHAFTLGHIFFRDIAGVTDDEMLYQLSKQFVEKSQYLYSTGDRAALITGPLGSVFGLFKNWPMHYISWMLEYTGEAFMRGNWKPLLFMTGGTTAVGGIAALPFYGAADTVSQWLTDESVMQHTYSQFGAAKRDEAVMSDAVFYGLPAMLGFSIQNQVAAPFADPGADAARLMQFAWWDRMKYFGKLGGSIVDQMAATGQNPISDQQTLNMFLRTFAPKNIYRTAQVIQDESLRSLTTGYPVANVSVAERVAFGFGLNPRFIERSYRVADELWDDQTKRLAAVSKYGQAYFEAQSSGDFAGMKNIITRAMFEGVDVSSVIKSAKARMAKNNEPLIERQFSPEAVLGYKKLGLAE